MNPLKNTLLKLES